jgi:hypothetical protein
MQHIVVLSIDSGDPSLTDFHHGLLGCVDILINNPSALAIGDDDKAWQTNFDVDLMASVRAARKGHAVDGGEWCRFYHSYFVDLGMHGGFSNCVGCDEGCPVQSRAHARTEARALSSEIASAARQQCMRQ